MAGQAVSLAASATAACLTLIDGSPVDLAGQVPRGNPDEAAIPGDPVGASSASTVTGSVAETINGWSPPT
jgi:hypothetical protein